MSELHDKAKIRSGDGFVKKAVISVVIVLGLILIDFGLKTWEAVNLYTAVEKSEAILLDFNRVSKDAALDKYLDLTQVTAEEAYVSGVAIERLVILPWHTALKNARDDYLEHNDAWYERLSTTRIEGDRVVSDGREDISPTWQQAKSSLPASIPSPDVLSLSERVEDIIAN